MKLLSVLLALLMFMRLSLMPDIALKGEELGTVDMTFVGDCTISTMKGSFKHGSLNWYTTNHEPTYFLEKVAPIFEEDDITVVNCETVLTDSELTERVKTDPGNHFWFRGPASNAKIFSSSSVEVACFANNHMNDYGARGQEDTVAALEAESLTVGEQDKPVYITKNGVTVAILACQIWNTEEGRALFPILDEMVENSDYQVLYPHGGMEGVYYVEPWRTNVFHELIDRGADLIVGSHAHLLQPIERYNGATIVYCLGNFCFGGNVKPSPYTAIYRCSIRLTEEGIEFEDRVIPCYVYTGSLNNWQPCPVEETESAYKSILDYMNGNRSTPVP